MRSFWNRAPMVRVAFALTAGITAEIIADEFLMLASSATAIASGLIAFVAIAILLLAWAIRISQKPSFGKWQGALVQVALISCGFSLAWFSTEKNYNTHFSKVFIDGDHLIVAIKDEPQPKKDKVITTASVIALEGSRHLVVEGKLRIAFARNAAALDVRYGDVIEVSAKPRLIPPPDENASFNYQRYAALH